MLLKDAQATKDKSFEILREIRNNVLPFQLLVQFLSTSLEMYFYQISLRCFWLRKPENQESEVSSP